MEESNNKYKRFTDLDNDARLSPSTRQEILEVAQQKEAFPKGISKFQSEEELATAVANVVAQVEDDKQVNANKRQDKAEYMSLKGGHHHKKGEHSYGQNTREDHTGRDQKKQSDGVDFSFNPTKNRQEKNTL